MRPLFKRTNERRHQRTKSFRNHFPSPERALISSISSHSQPHSFIHSFIDSPSAHTNHLPRFHNIYSLCFAACIISLLKFTAPFSSITCLFAFAFVCTPASKPPFLFFFVTFNSRRGNFPHLHIWSKELGLRHCQYPPCVSRTCCTNSSA